VVLQDCKTITPPCPSQSIWYNHSPNLPQIFVTINVHTLNNFQKLRDFAEFKIQFCLISTLPLWVFVCKQNQATNSEKKVSWTLARDENFNFRVALWADFHGLLFNALPSNIFFWGHLFLSFCVSDDKTSIKVKAKVLQTDETIEIVEN
jgi:hypothetical protein